MQIDVFQTIEQHPSLLVFPVFTSKLTNADLIHASLFNIIVNLLSIFLVIFLP